MERLFQIHGDPQGITLIEFGPPGLIENPEVNSGFFIYRSELGSPGRNWDRRKNFTEKKNFCVKNFLQLRSKYSGGPDFWKK